jgi:hypothetical protein
VDSGDSPKRVHQQRWRFWAERSRNPPIESRKMPFSSMLGLNRLFQTLNQRRQVNGDCVAHALQVHIKVNVDETMSHAYDIDPWNLQI